MLENVWLFLAAFTINLRLGAIALCAGLLVGFVSAMLRFRSTGPTSWLMGFFIGFLRAFPVYVLMFVAINWLVSVGVFDSLSPKQAAETALVIALSAYTISACSDASLSFLQHWSRGQYSQAWLIGPNIVQIYVITVMSSSVGAAIGLQEAVTFTLALAESLPTRSERILLVFVVIVFFALIMGLTRWGVKHATTVMRVRAKGRQPTAAN